jgi:hypothetical protein
VFYINGKIAEEQFTRMIKNGSYKNMLKRNSSESIYKNNQYDVAILEILTEAWFLKVNLLMVRKIVVLLKKVNGKEVEVW